MVGYPSHGMPESTGSADGGLAGARAMTRLVKKETEIYSDNYKGRPGVRTRNGTIEDDTLQEGFQKAKQLVPCIASTSHIDAAFFMGSPTACKHPFDDRLVALFASHTQLLRFDC